MIKPGNFILDCDNMPGIVTEVYSDSIDYYGLAQLGEGSCHPIQCNPKKVDYKTVIKYLEAYKKNGELGVALLSGYTEEWFLAFEKEWRSDSNYCKLCHKFNCGKEEHKHVKKELS